VGGGWGHGGLQEEKRIIREGGEAESGVAGAGRGRFWGIGVTELFAPCRKSGKLSGACNNDGVGRL
jgi:hypothetical protein